MKIRKNQKWVIFWPIFAFFEVFAHFLSRIWTTLVGHHFFWILRFIRIQNCLRIFSSSNGLSATAAQTMVILHFFSHFCKFWHFFGNFFNILRIFSAVSCRIFKRIFSAESWGFYASNGVYSFAVAIIVTEILKDLLRPFWWIFYKFFKNLLLFCVIMTCISVYW